MDKFKKIIAAILVLTLGVSVITGCGQKKQQRGPLDVKKVCYLVYLGGIDRIELYVITSDYKVKEYSMSSDPNNKYDYINEELPPEGQYELKEYEISELSWTSMVNVLTRVGFMEIKEDLSAKGDIDDASSYYIKVETADAVHISGGYAAGTSGGSDNTNFEEARQYIRNALKNT